MTILLPSGVKITPQSDDVARQILKHTEGSVEVKEATKSEEKTSRTRKSAE